MLIPVIRSRTLLLYSRLNDIVSFESTNDTKTANFFARFQFIMDYLFYQVTLPI